MNVPMAPLSREHLARLLAEWQFAMSQADLARTRVEHAVGVAARGGGVEAPFDLDLAAGQWIIEDRPQTNDSEHDPEPGEA